jgi:hypothetical protein
VLVNGDAILDVWVPGQPTPFANPPYEALWKQALSSHLPASQSALKGDGIALDFFLAPGRYNRRDLDNLCEPVFSVLVNQKRWFEGRRPNIAWLQATKTLSEESGLRIRLLDEAPRLGAESPVCLNAVYPGPLPKSARDTNLAEWARSLSMPSVNCDFFSVHLSFGSSNVNLGDIATGPIKSILDCLYPVIGGRVGAPEDWRITALVIEKNMPAVPPGHVQISVAPSIGGA